MTHYIYIVAHKMGKTLQSPVKIGITSNRTGRLAALQTGNASKLVVAMSLAVPNAGIARYIEAAFHQLQATKRLQGEWFDIPVGKAAHLLAIYFRGAIEAHVGEDANLIVEIEEASGLSEILKRLGPTNEGAIH